MSTGFSGKSEKPTNFLLKFIQVTQNLVFLVKKRITMKKVFEENNSRVKAINRRSQKNDPIKMEKV